jgi:hypothetical protein
MASLPLGLLADEVGLPLLLYLTRRSSFSTASQSLPTYVLPDHEVIRPSFLT